MRSRFVLAMWVALLLVAHGLSFQVVCSCHPSPEWVTKKVSTWMMILPGILKDNRKSQLMPMFTTNCVLAIEIN